MAGLNDGLGYEEIGQVGSQVASLWVTGSIVSASDIAAVNMSATTAITAATVSGTTAVKGTLIGAGNITAAGSVISTGNVVSNSKILSPAGAGSPAVWGKLIQAGSAALSAGSAAWVAFPVAFGAVPSIQLTAAATAGNNDLFVSGGLAGVGSFYTQGKTASEVFHWIALG